MCSDSILWHKILSETNGYILYAKFYNLDIAKDKFYIPNLIKYYYKQEENVVNILAITYFSFDFIKCKPKNFEEPKNCETLIVRNTQRLKFLIKTKKEKHIFTEYSLEWGKPFKIEAGEKKLSILNQ